MNKEKLKKKIVEIIINAIWKDAEADYDSTDETEACSIADALIEAGIGDVQSLVDGTCVLCVKDKGIMRLYNEQEINEMIHRKEVAERALLTACVNFIKDEKDNVNNVNMELLVRVVYDKYLKQAEKELAELKGGKNE